MPPRPLGQSQRLFSGRHAPPAPIVLSISPNMGSSAGGTPVTITGANFLTATSAAVGGVNLSSFVVVDDNHITGTTGVHADGAANVTATSPSGTSAPLVGGFTYVFDAATLPWTGWWMDRPVPPPAVVSWPGTPSVGTSGAHALGTIGSAVGASLNGHVTADYAGPRDASAATADQFYSDTAYGGTILFNLRTLGPDPGIGSPYFGPALLGYATVALFGVTAHVGGIDVWQYDGAWHSARLPAPAINTWTRVAWKFGGGGLRAQLNSSPWIGPVAVTPGWGGFSINANQMSIGSTTYGAPIDGRIACMQLTDVVLSDLNFASDLSWANATFGLAL